MYKLWSFPATLLSDAMINGGQLLVLSVTNPEPLPHYGSSTSGPRAAHPAHRPLRATRVAAYKGPPETLYKETMHSALNM